MKIKKISITSLVLAGLISTANAVDIMVESFETDGNGVRYTSSTEFNDGSHDHWARTDGGNISNVTGPYSAFDGTFFWAAEDVNDNGGNGLDVQTIEFTDIDIDGLIDLSFSGLFAAGNENGPGASNYDAADFIRVEYRIDGSGADPFTSGVCFGFERTSAGDNSNEPFGLDADCDGESDGVAGRLGTAMVEHGFTIAATGVTLDLLVSVRVDSGSEEIAFDNLKIISGVGTVDVPPTVTSTNPADGSVGFDRTADITINFSEPIDATASAVTLICTTSGTVAFAGLPITNASAIIINPDTSLVDSETCDLTVVATEVTDLDDTIDAMVSDFSMSFIVGFPVVEIFEIQGSGMATSFSGQTVISLDNIVTVLDTNGFYMQTPDARDDGVLATSNGIFVFTGSPVPVAVGDQIDLTGEVTEFFDLTEFTNPGSYILTIDSSNNTLPAAILLNDSFPPTDPTLFPCGTEALEYECFEGMHFDMPQGFISSAFVFFFGANRDDVLVKAGSARAVREPGIDYPGIVGFPVFDGNPEILEMDIDALGLALTAYSAGSELAVKGVFGFDFGEYEIWPSEITVVNENVLPGAVRDGEANEITIGSANLFRLFNAIDDPGPEDDSQIADPAEYASRLLKISNYIINDMRSPIIIALQEIENIGVMNDLVSAISTAGGPTYVAALVEGNDVGGIDVAYLYQDALLSNVTITQLGAIETLTFDGSLLHDRPPLRLKADVVLADDTVTINVLVVHMRSRGGIDDATDGARVRQKRLEQAQSVAIMADGIMTEDTDIGLYVVGDYNAFEFTDGYVDVVGQITGTALDADDFLWEEPLFVAAPLTQAVHTLTVDEQYSFVFRGSAQILDNAIMNDKGLTDFVEMRFVRGQADASINFEDDDAVSLRSTDHDGFVLYIFQDNDLIFKNGFE